jgi:hypothetical protein
MIGDASLAKISEMILQKNRFSEMCQFSAKVQSAKVFEGY